MNREILRLAVPNLISNITVPLLGAIDLAMIGRMNDLTYVGAISLGAMIFNFIYWSLGFLRMGTCGFTAQSFGARKPEECTLTLLRSLFIALCGAALLLILQSPVLHIALLWAQPEAALAEATASYFRIRIWAAPATISAFAFAGWFIGMQDSRTPMWVAIGINVANVLFNYYFIFHAGMGSDGVALGTLCAQYTGLLMNIGFAIRTLRKKEAGWPVSFRKVWIASALRRFLHVNSDIFLRTLLIIAVFSFFTAQSSRLGNEYLVLNTFLYQFFIFYSYAMDGFAHAAEALSGRFTGSGEKERKRKTVRQVFRWGLGIAVLFTTVYAVAYTPILRIFTSEAHILEMSRDYYLWILAISLIGFPAFLWDGVYAGSLATKPMLATMFLSTLVFFLSYYAGAETLHNHAMWLAMTLFLLTRGLSMGLYARKIIGR